MSINIQNLIHALEQKQNSISSALDIMQLTKAIDLLRLNKVFFIEKFNVLPDANDTPLGTLYYVEEELSLYVLEYDAAVGNKWRNLVETDSSIFGWGQNGNFHLGDETSTDRSSPVSVIGGITDWCQVSIGQIHTAAVRSNGTLWSWGFASQGRLGNNYAAGNFSSPVSVVGGFTDWCQVSSGQCHTTAVRTNGTLWSWGNNTCGRLGDGTTVNKSSPISVVGGFTDWCQVSADCSHTAAVRTNGTIWTWGVGVSGRLGDGTTVDKSSPVSVVGGFTDWCQVSVGGDHNAAVRINGTIWTWGIGIAGRLGDGTTVDKSSPVSVVGGFTDWCQASVGLQHTAAVRINGTLWTWGSNFVGALGDGTTTAKSSPVSVVGGFTDWCQVSAGQFHNVAIKTNGTIWSWGSGNYGRLGNGTTVDKSSPTSIGNIRWSKIEAGTTSSMAVIIKDKNF